MEILYFCNECGKPVSDCHEWQSFCSLIVKEKVPVKEDPIFEDLCFCIVNQKTKFAA